MARAPKPLLFMGNSDAELRAFSGAVKNEVGHALYLVKLGREPPDWKPMPSVGSGVSEIRVRDDAGIFRVLYVARFLEAVYVLHCFQKKTQQTASRDIELGQKRYKELVTERSAALSLVKTSKANASARSAHVGNEDKGYRE